MPAFMPYTTEKSQLFQVAEWWVNSSRTRALDTLWHFLDPNLRVVDLPFLDSDNVVGGGPPDERRRHLTEDWWGWKQPSPRPNDRDPFDPNQAKQSPANPTTGFWRHWYGNAHAVFRETMVRALTVSLGLTRDATEQHDRVPESQRPDGQHWPISIIWKCPSPWYEGWIEFKRYGDEPNDGHVTVVLNSPSHGVKLYDQPVKPGSVVNPKAPAGPEGLWVVSQTLHVLLQGPTPPPTGPPGLPGADKTPAMSWTPPTLGQPVHSKGQVVCVAPQIGDGGVNPAGMPYVAPRHP